MEKDKKVILVPHSSNSRFCKRVAFKAGRALTDVDRKQFSDGESYVHVSESVREHDTFIIYSKGDNVNDDIIETYLLACTLKRSSAKSITLVAPYYPYARQDRKTISREPISASDITTLYNEAGINRIISVDLHNASIQGFTKDHLPFDNLSARPLFIKYVEEHIMAINHSTLSHDSFMIVSPDSGGASRANSLAKKLNLDMTMLYKKRSSASKIEIMKLLGTVKNKVCIIIDDMADTCGTLCKAVDVLVEDGAGAVYAMVTHGLLSKNAVENINNSQLTELIVTNSVKLGDKMKHCSKLKVLDISPLLAAVINNNVMGQTTSPIFEPEFYNRPINHYIIDNLKTRHHSRRSLKELSNSIEEESDTISSDSVGINIDNIGDIQTV